MRIIRKTVSFKDTVYSVFSGDGCGHIHGGDFMSTEGNLSVVQQMAYRYNQLYLTPERGMSGTAEYSDIVCYGVVPDRLVGTVESGELSGFTGSVNDRFFSETTPAGVIEIVYLEERSDFERFLQIMAYGGEPAQVASRTESAEILGVTNWRRIEKHFNEYMASTGRSLSLREEMRMINSEKKSFQDSIILIGSGGYCGIKAEEAGFDADVWNDISVKIKTYSSCARFIMRKVFSDYRNIIWEEMLSDCIGLLFTFNRYDVSLAKKFFGVSKKGYDRRGKLINFCGESPDDADQLAVRVSEAIDKLGSRTKKLISAGITDYYDVLFRLEEHMNEYVSVIKG